jgi:hypothetical protein
MKTGKILLFGVMAVSLRVTYAAQSGELGSGMAGLGNGVSVRIVTKAEPSEKASLLKLSNLYNAGNGVLHRSVIDTANRTYFGYDLYAEPMAGSRQCRVAILPLTSGRGGDVGQPSPYGSTSATAGGRNPIQPDASYRPLFLPVYPGPKVIANGDIIALELLTTPDGQQKVVDYIDVSCNSPDDSSASTAARDASLDDLEIPVSDPSTYLNGALVSGPARGVHLSGSLVWFCFPRKGRFILSVVPRQNKGFVLAGTIHNNVISFKFGAEQYEVRSTVAIFGPGGTRNLYVLRDLSFESKPKVPFGSAMRLEQLFSNRQGERK